MQCWILPAIVTGVFACAEQREPEPVLVPASRDLQQNEQSRASGLDRPIEDSDAFAVTRERCDRERRCEHLGAGKRFVSRGECLRTLSQRDFATFGPAGCRAGVDREQLSLCLRSIRAEACATSLETLVTLDECQPERVCR